MQSSDVVIQFDNRISILHNSIASESLVFSSETFGNFRPLKSDWKPPHNFSLQSEATQPTTKITEMNTIQFDQLPDECLKRIFEFLSLRDRVKCREVNRQFKFLADQVEIQELVVSDSKSLDCKCQYPNNQQISNQNAISLEAFTFLDFSPLQLNEQLKFLHIHLDDEVRWSRMTQDFKLVNSFKQLVQLEIELKAQRVRPVTLSLPNLKMLGFHESNPHPPLLYLKTPMLEVLSCEVLDGIRLTYPRKIKHLSCACTASYMIGVNHMAKFKNLEVLDCRSWLRNLNLIHLAYWKSLKELNVIVEPYYDEYSEEFLSWLVDIRGQQNVQNRELKLSVNGRLFDNTEETLLGHLQN